MYLPVISGLIKRRILVNFRADPDITQKLLPIPFRPKLHRGHAIVGICLIRLENIRPAGLPALLNVGLDSENAAHRIAVEWTDQHGSACEGVFIPRRDTNSHLAHLAGGRIFPGEHHLARIQVKDADGRIDYEMQSLDQELSVRVVGEEAEALPPNSCFASLEETSSFFQTGSFGYSITRAGDHYDGLELRTKTWLMRPFAVRGIFSSYYGDPRRFPIEAITFDHALIMRDISHEWHAAADLPVACVCA